MKVKIYDAIMGSGKTYDAIERMKQNKGNFIYVTPFLDEVDRIIKNVPKVYQPKITSSIDPITSEKIIKYKRDNLLIMANGHVNMATTHSLFQKLNRNDYKHFMKYDLILDEVITPIQIIDMKPDDINIAFNEGLIVKNEQTGEITYTGDEYRGKFYSKLKQYCDTANVIYINGNLLVWAFPPEIFKNFKSVTVLTYLFEGSQLSAYFRYYDIPYKLINTSDKDEQIKKAKINNLLNIYDGRANKVGDFHSAFCVNWLNNKSPDEFKKMRTTASNILERNFNTKSEETGFTTFKAYKDKLKGKGYSKGFIPVNERATNKYSNKESMVYFANRYLNPRIIDFFRSGDIEVDQEQWALGELLQWIWRGCIRNDEPMNLYIPSKRMRELLQDWLKSGCNIMANAA